MIFEFGYHKIDVDVEKTRAFYEQAELLTEGCECLNCKKYEKAVDFADVELCKRERKDGISRILSSLWQTS